MTDTDNTVAAKVIHAPWTDGTVALAHNTKVRMTYRDITHTGLICDGLWRVKSHGVTKEFKSPSLAANFVARTRANKKTRLNGWVYWEAYFAPEHKWVKISDLRA